MGNTPENKMENESETNNNNNKIKLISEKDFKRICKKFGFTKTEDECKEYIQYMLLSVLDKQVASAMLMCSESVFNTMLLDKKLGKQSIKLTREYD